MNNQYSFHIEPSPSKPNPDHFQLLSQKISSINKKLINEPFKKDSIKRLEKEVIRNQQSEKPKKRNASQDFTRLDMISLILTSNQKEKNNSNSTRLGRTPYGKHHSYNEEDYSVIQKIFTTSNDAFDSQGETLTEIKNKFKLNDRRQKCSRKVSFAERRASYMDFFDTFDMKHGKLYCEKNNDVVQTYVKGVEKFRKNWFSSFDCGDQRKKVDKKLQDFSISRLYSGARNRSKKDTYFTKKYKVLFGEGGVNVGEKSGSRDICVINL